MACAGDSNTAMSRTEDRRRRVLLGPLPAGFLCTTAPAAADTLDADHQAALALQQQLSGATMAPTGPPLTGRLSITVLQAKLVKNYGITRMDPYVRLRVGHCMFETHTDPSGGKMPRWNKVIHCLLPPGVNSIYLEIYDECSFTMDELIAWTHIEIPSRVLNGETHEDWFPLTGKQGEGQEGMINLVLSYAVVPNMATYPPVLVVPNTGLGYATMPVFPAQPPPAVPPTAAQPPAQPISAETLQQLSEMFPSVEKEVIRSVLEANAGNKETTINCLLQMSE